ncbi:MAG: peptidase inhibitor family I36 protein [Nannocystis sp.]|nr:peptidase inhibitor family I36 protein [Nannocystis sp.]MBA3544901.1 peptidase inhibitor family I36 protein [Nannocystis sp.]
MLRTIGIICTVSLFVPACDDAEDLDDEIRGADADDDDLADPVAAQTDVEAVVEGTFLGTCATLYEHKDFKGSRLEVNKGAVKWIGGPWNDQVSSLKVRAGCVLNAYEHVNFGGAHKAFQANVPWVGAGWNDKISSFVCSC